MRGLRALQKKSRVQALFQRRETQNGIAESCPACGINALK